MAVNTSNPSIGFEENESNDWKEPFDLQKKLFKDQKELFDLQKKLFKVPFEDWKELFDFRMVSFEDIWSNNSPWQRPIFISGVPGGTCIISSNFEIDTVKLDPLSDDLPEAVSAFLEKNTPNLVQFVHAIKASAYLDPIPKGLKAKVRNWEDLKGFTAADCRNHILNILGNNFTRADVSIRDGFHFSKADQSVDGPIPFG